MSGLSGVGPSSANSNTTTNGAQGTLGNAAPISFPGIASGIDYNAIIQKLTSMTLAQNKPLSAQSTALASANQELIKINGLVQKVQQAIMNLGDPTLFNQFGATVSNTAVASAAQTTGLIPTPGTYSILAQTLATATQITSSTAANSPVNQSATLATAGFQITPSNGSGTGSGKFTINGQQITYDVGTDTVATILAKINALTGVTASFSGDKLTITSTSGPLTLGSASDSGNLAQIFKIDVAQIGGGGTTVTSAATVGGINPNQSLDTINSATPLNNGTTFTINGVTLGIDPTQNITDIINEINASSAGVTAAWNTTLGQLQLTSKTTGPQSIVLGSPSDSSNFLQVVGLTSSQALSTGVGGGMNATALLNTYDAADAGTGAHSFTINGTAINYNVDTDTATTLVNTINTAGIAGVTASFDTTTNQIVLSSTSGSLNVAGDTGNLVAALFPSTVATTVAPATQVGQQASVTYQTPSGGSATVYSNSNQVTTAIPGVTLTLTQSTATPYTVTVSSSNTKLVSAINDFITAYNNAIGEINSATAPPVVQTKGQGVPAQPGTTSSTQVLPGGVLFNNYSVQSLKDQLVSLISNFVSNGSTSYNSFASVGLNLDTSVAVITSKSTSGASDSKDSKDSSDSSGLQTQTFGGTSGKLQALDTATFDSALAANPTIVQGLFTGASGILAGLGNYLTYVTGTPTQLGPQGSFLGTAPDVSLLQGLENTNSSQIDSINQQISLVNDMAIAQANQLRAEFNASETMIAQLQQEQQSLASFLGNSSSSSGSSG